MRLFTVLLCLLLINSAPLHAARDKMRICGADLNGDIFYDVSYQLLPTACICVLAVRFDTALNNKTCVCNLRISRVYLRMYVGLRLGLGFG